jgi:hypothetical protein
MENKQLLRKKKDSRQSLADVGRNIFCFSLLTTMYTYKWSWAKIDRKMCNKKKKITKIQKIKK